MHLDRCRRQPTTGLWTRAFAGFVAAWLMVLTILAADSRFHAELHDAGEHGDTHTEGCALCLFAEGLLTPMDPPEPWVEPVSIPEPAWMPPNGQCGAPQVDRLLAGRAPPGWG